MGEVAAWRVLQRARAAAGAEEEEHASNTDGELPQQHADIQHVMTILERLVAESGSGVEGDDEGEWGDAREVSRAGRAAELAASVAAASASLARARRSRLHARLMLHLQAWLHILFRLEQDWRVLLHREPMDGLVRLARTLLHHKYPHYLEQGGGALTERTPCVYACTGWGSAAAQHVCAQLGLPLTCVRVVPADTATGETLDVGELEGLLRADAAAGRVPLLVVGAAGEGLRGYAESSARMRATCATFAAHLHLQGPGLAALALHPPDTERYMTTRAADSLTLDLPLWLAAPALPHFTVFSLQPRNPPIEALGGLCETEESRWGAVCAWAGLRVLGRDEMTALLAGRARALHTLYAGIAQISTLRLLSKPPGIEVDDALSRDYDAEELLNGTLSCVTFRFVGEGVPDTQPDEYLDRLNTWLGQILQQTTELCIEVCSSAGVGVVLRVAGGAGAMCEEDVRAGVEAVRRQVDIVAATLALRDTFTSLVLARPSLRLVRVPGWAGLGGVRYVPHEPQLTRALVNQLQATDSAFSCGEGDDGDVCVRFGMVTDDTDVEELVSLVEAAGLELKQQGETLHHMTDLVKKGIEEATLQLERESLEQVFAGGVLRALPVVGRVVDWWSPTPAAAPRGRSLHLTRGTLEPTDHVYRCRKQSPAEPPPTPSPPPSPHCATD